MNQHLRMNKRADHTYAAKIHGSQQSKGTKKMKNFNCSKDVSSTHSSTPNMQKSAGPLQSTPFKGECPSDSMRQMSTHHKSIDGKIYKKSIWTKEEDDLLQKMVNQKGIGIWKEISTFIPNRTGKQCRQRWHNHLRQGVTKQPWTPEQFWILALSVRAFGTKWSAIAKYLPERSDNTIKNQWNCKMKPYKEKFSNQIDKLLLDPACWASLSKNEQELLSIISRSSDEDKQNQPPIPMLLHNSVILNANFDEEKMERKRIKNMMKIYEFELEQALRDFESIDCEENMEISQFQLCEDQSPDQIIGGQRMFQEPQDFFFN